MADQMRGRVADDLDAFVRFYTDVLGFTLTVDQRDADYPYAAVESGSVRIGAARSLGAKLLAASLATLAMRAVIRI